MLTAIEYLGHKISAQGLQPTSEKVQAIYEVEMQQYIDISPYHDTLGDDTVSIHI